MGFQALVGRVDDDINVGERRSGGGATGVANVVGFGAYGC